MGTLKHKKVYVFVELGILLKKKSFGSFVEETAKRFNTPIKQYLFCKNRKRHKMFVVRSQKGDHKQFRSLLLLRHRVYGR